MMSFSWFSVAWAWYDLRGPGMAEEVLSPVKRPLGQLEGRIRRRGEGKDGGSMSEPIGASTASLGACEPL